MKAVRGFTFSAYLIKDRGTCPVKLDSFRTGDGLFR